MSNNAPNIILHNHKPPSEINQSLRYDIPELKLIHFILKIILSKKLNKTKQLNISGGLSQSSSEKHHGSIKMWHYLILYLTIKAPI